MGNQYASSTMGNSSIMNVFMENTDLFVNRNQEETIKLLNDISTNSSEEDGFAYSYYN